ncbi:MAG: AAA family ATPase [Oscillospiraceae bacterium]|nr:AAA family ATPase [Oscillospiraceae bacterium]
MTREDIAAAEQNTFCLKNLEPQEVQWLWYPYIPRGKLTIMQGDPGEGKTTLALHLAACVTTGYFPGCAEKELAGTVILQSAEDGMRDTIVPRLEQAGADRSRIRSIYENFDPLTLTDERLANILEVYSPDLLIIDPLQAYLGANVDMHRANEVRPVMSHLSELADRFGIAILLVGHMNKNAGLKALYKGLGSIDITASARSVLLVAKNPKDPSMIYMGQIKSSLAPAGAVVGFERTDTGALRYAGEQHVNMQELIDGTSRVRPRERAGEFLEEILADGKKPVAAVKEAASSRGIAIGTLRRAYKELGIQHIRVGNEHYMALPKADTEPEPAPQPPAADKINMEEYYSEELGRYLTPEDFEPLPY